jgi:hypothetical protein
VLLLSVLLAPLAHCQTAAGDLALLPLPATAPQCAALYFEWSGNLRGPYELAVFNLEGVKLWRTAVPEASTGRKEFLAPIPAGNSIRFQIADSQGLLYGRLHCGHCTPC